MKQKNLRASAAIILSKLLHQEGSLATLLDRRDNLQDYPLLQEICFGTCRWYFQLEAILRQLLRKPLKAKDADLYCLLLIGIYQLHYLRVPPYAVVNETVAATLALDKSWAKALVNGVLRSFLRDAEKLLGTAMAISPQAHYAHPQWFIERMKTAWPEHWENILAANNLHPPMTLRINLSRISRSDYLSLLDQAGIDAQPGSLAESSIYLSAPRSVDSIPGFAEGLASVQDEASQLIPGLLDLHSGQTVLDACAAPGGKTCHILESGHSLAQVVAIDNDERRLEKLHQNLNRLNLSARMLVADATEPEKWWDGQAFDRILLDAPCSATGIIRRHPDIKLLRNTQDLRSLGEVQRKLLNELWQCLAPGGLLLYSTCSVLPEENSELIGGFLENHPEVKEVLFAAKWGVECRHGRQLLPQANGNDGFYFALLHKSAVTQQCQSLTFAED